MMENFMSSLTSAANNMSATQTNADNSSMFSKVLGAIDPTKNMTDEEKNQYMSNMANLAKNGGSEIANPMTSLDATQMGIMSQGISKGINSVGDTFKGMFAGDKNHPALKGMGKAISEMAYEDSYRMKETNGSGSVISMFNKFSPKDLKS